MKAILHLLHLAGVIVWLGGMFFALFCLRPVAATQLPPPQRLPLMAAVLGRFFVAVLVAIVVILASGLGLMLPGGMAAAPVHWHLMLANGLLMALIFAVIYRHHHPRLQAAVTAADWPAAGAALNAIRQLVAVNLALGALTVATAVLGAYL
ncbi:MAG TPA: DUF4149 domain-containing protein [Azonexus sp.]